MSLTKIREWPRPSCSRCGASTGRSPSGSGALDDRFLGRARPLGEARVLWEIGVEGCEVRSLRSRLALDSGHLSRLLRSLESDGLVRVEPSPSDRRVRVARLTAGGLAEREELEERSDGVASSILASVGPEHRGELVSAMHTVERLLMHGNVQLREVDPAGSDARACIRAYFAELDRRSDTGFDPGSSLPADPEDFTPPRGAFLGAYQQDEPVGCGGVRHLDGGISEIKRMWVAESVRGLGIGRRLLAELESRAREAGSSAVRLDTNRLAGRGHLHVPVGRLRRGGALQRRVLRPPLVSQGAGRRLTSEMDLKLELLPVPVSDVDRAKAFYSERAGFNVDNDVTVREGLRFVQLTPPGSACSISIGEGITEMEPGSLEGLQLVVDDIESSRDELSARGLEVSEIQDFPWGRFVFFSDPDGNGWAVQQIPDYGEGRTQPEGF